MTPEEAGPEPPGWRSQGFLAAAVAAGPVAVAEPEPEPEPQGWGEHEAAAMMERVTGLAEPGVGAQRAGASPTWSLRQRVAFPCQLPGEASPPHPSHGAWNLQVLCVLPGPPGQLPVLERWRWAWEPCPFHRETRIRGAPGPSSLMSRALRGAIFGSTIPSFDVQDWHLQVRDLMRKKEMKRNGKKRKREKELLLRVELPLFLSPIQRSNGAFSLGGKERQQGHADSAN